MGGAFSTELKRLEMEMGYTAATTEVNFHIPADKVPAALAALNSSQFDVGTVIWKDGKLVTRVPDEDEEDSTGYRSLIEAVEENTNFHDCTEDETGFSLGHHWDKWYELSEEFLQTLAPFADEGSVVRLQGEDDELFGYRVVNGKLEQEVGDFVWRLWSDVLAEHEAAKRDEGAGE